MENVNGLSPNRLREKRRGFVRLSGTTADRESCRRRDVLSFCQPPALLCFATVWGGS